MKDKATTSPYMSIAQTAAHFSVSYTTIQKGRSIFAGLRFVQIGARKMIMRADVEALDCELAARARSVREGLRLVEKKRA